MKWGHFSYTQGTPRWWQALVRCRDTQSKQKQKTECSRWTLSLKRDGIPSYVASTFNIIITTLRGSHSASRSIWFLEQETKVKEIASNHFSFFLNFKINVCVSSERSHGCSSSWLVRDTQGAWPLAPASLQGPWVTQGQGGQKQRAEGCRPPSEKTLDMVTNSMESCSSWNHRQNGVQGSRRTAQMETQLFIGACTGRGLLAQVAYENAKVPATTVRPSCTLRCGPLRWVLPGTSQGRSPGACLLQSPALAQQLSQRRIQACTLIWSHLYPSWQQWVGRT